MTAGLIPPSVYREMWRTPRGKGLARRVAFRDLSYAEYHRLPLCLMLEEAMHELALPGDLTAEQEELLWGLAQAVQTAAAARELGWVELTALATTAKGTPFLWEGVKGKLGPSLRGPFAYVFGRVYLRKDRPKEAEAFFRTARDGADPASPLYRLANAELERLKGR
jgi:hypothetical protein